VNFPFTVYIPALAVAFIAALLSLPLWRRFSQRTGLVDAPGHRKIHQTPIPLAGGFTVLTGIVLPLLLGVAAWNRHSPVMNLGEQFVSYGLRPGHRALELAAIILGALGMVILGWLDDKFELRPSIKFGGQLAIALLVVAADVRITLFVHNAAFSYAITILWILTVTNAFNFMDNMNGLCAGLGAIGAWYFAVIAAVEGQYLVALLGFLTCGALLGFLPYNFPRASAFLGDAGSHLVGYLLAVMAILPHFYTPQHPHVWAVLTPLLILAVPLGDLAWVVLLRRRLGQPFYVGDNNHLSHRLVRNGWSKSTAVLLIWLLATLLGGLALLLALA
jgi:UDP-GlcNAc:undecaprenyl-phosphate GlcNAc-1-phosphate transferase